MYYRKCIVEMNINIFYEFCRKKTIFYGRIKKYIHFWLLNYVVTCNIILLQHINKFWTIR